MANTNNHTNRHTDRVIYYPKFFLFHPFASTAKEKQVIRNSSIGKLTIEKDPPSGLYARLITMFISTHYVQNFKNSYKKEQITIDFKNCKKFLQNILKREINYVKANEQQKKILQLEYEFIENNSNQELFSKKDFKLGIVKKNKFVIAKDSGNHIHEQCFAVNLKTFQKAEITGALEFDIFFWLFYKKKQKQKTIISLEVLEKQFSCGRNYYFRKIFTKTIQKYCSLLDLKGEIKDKYLFLTKTE